MSESTLVLKIESSEAEARLERFIRETRRAETAVKGLEEGKTIQINTDQAAAALNSLGEKAMTTLGALSGLKSIGTPSLAPAATAGALKFGKYAAVAVAVVGIAKGMFDDIASLASSGRTKTANDIQSAHSAYDAGVKVLDNYLGFVWRATGATEGLANVINELSPGFQKLKQESKKLEKNKKASLISQLSDIAFEKELASMKPVDQRATLQKKYDEMMVGLPKEALEELSSSKLETVLQTQTQAGLIKNRITALDEQESHRKAEEENRKAEENRKKIADAAALKERQQARSSQLSELAFEEKLVTVGPDAQMAAMRKKLNGMMKGLKEAIQPQQIGEAELETALKTLGDADQLNDRIATLNESRQLPGEHYVQNPSSQAVTRDSVTAREMESRIWSAERGKENKSISDTAKYTGEMRKSLAGIATSLKNKVIIEFEK